MQSLMHKGVLRNAHSWLGSVNHDLWLFAKSNSSLGNKLLLQYQIAITRRQEHNAITLLVRQHTKTHNVDGS